VYRRGFAVATEGGIAISEKDRPPVTDEKGKAVTSDGELLNTRL
jgi:hypothetical protein